MILTTTPCFRYGVLSYTNLFFTCKNTLVITLLLYRLVMVQVERRSDFRRRSTDYLDMSDSDSRLKLTLNNIHPDRRLAAGDAPATYEKLDNDKVGRQLLQEAGENEADAAEKESAIYDETPDVVDYIIMRHISNHDMKLCQERPPPMISYAAVSMSDGLATDGDEDSTDDDKDNATSANSSVNDVKSTTLFVDNCRVGYVIDDNTVSKEL